MSRAIPPQLRRKVWETYMKNPKGSEGPCFCCKTNIHILQFECGHKVSYAKGGPTTLENLRPVCGSCNKSMGTKDMYDYMNKFFPPSSGTKLVSTSSLLDTLVSSFVSLTINSHGCQHALLKGKRKGEKCGQNVQVKGGLEYCSRHLASHVFTS